MSIAAASCQPDYTRRGRDGNEGWHKPGGCWYPKWCKPLWIGVIGDGNTLVYRPGFSHWKWVPSSGCPLLWVFPHLGSATSFYSVILCKPFLSSENSEQLLLLLVGAGFSLFSTVRMFDWYPVMCMLWPCTQRSISEGHSLTFSSINLASLVACCCKLCSLTLFLKRFRFS